MYKRQAPLPPVRDERFLEKERGGRMETEKTGENKGAGQAEAFAGIANLSLGEADSPLARVYACLGEEPEQINDIAVRAGLSTRQASAILARLEIEHLAMAHPGKAYSRVEEAGS